MKGKKSPRTSRFHGNGSNLGGKEKTGGGSSLIWDARSGSNVEGFVPDGSPPKSRGLGAHLRQEHCTSKTLPRTKTSGNLNREWGKELRTQRMEETHGGGGEWNSWKKKKVKVAFPGLNKRIGKAGCGAKNASEKAKPIKKGLGQGGDC